MDTIKIGGKVYGAKLTAAEKKALDIEARKAIAEHSKKFNRDFSAMVLYRLREQYGFSDWELKEFYRYFNSELDKLAEHYEMDDSDDAWLATYMLKQEGIDLEEWEEELLAK